MFFILMYIVFGKVIFLMIYGFDFRLFVDKIFVWFDIVL